MNLEQAQELARGSRLYPGLILHGASREGRIAAGVDLARTLLCEAEEPSRPCGGCRHCRRIRAPDGEATAFHPDFFLVERDLRTATSVEAVKTMLRSAQLRPFEARGQVFALADAETLQPAGADALLKSLEEPPTTAPRHFLLLAPSAVELLPTLRSRSLSIYLGAGRELDPEVLAPQVEPLREAIDAYRESGSPVMLLAIARLLFDAGSWQDTRSALPFSQAAWLLLQVSKEQPSRELRAALLTVAESLLDGIELRVRNVPALRILEGALAQGLGDLAAAPDRAS